MIPIRRYISLLSNYLGNVKLLLGLHPPEDDIAAAAYAAALEGYILAMPKRFETLVGRTGCAHLEGSFNARPRRGCSCVRPTY